MANRISDRMVKAFERFNADLETFFSKSDSMVDVKCTTEFKKV